MAALEATESRWVEACPLEDVVAASAKHRGHHVSKADGDGSVHLSFFQARDGTLSCVETPCPHAGHRLSNGPTADPGDIEDIVSGKPCGVLVSCPAHSYVYRSGVF